jgi:methyl-accepting chemotaxis protein
MFKKNQTESSANRRSVFLINPKFQLQVIGYAIALAALTIGIFYGANLYFFWEFKQQGTAVGLPTDHVFFRFMSEQQSRMNVLFLFGSLAVTTVISVGGLVLSHRIAGPLYRLHKHMMQVAEGKTTQDVSFRDKDFFQELENSYNSQLKLVRGEKSGSASSNEVSSKDEDDA